MTSFRFYLSCAQLNNKRIPPEESDKSPYLRDDTCQKNSSCSSHGSWSHVPIHYFRKDRLLLALRLRSRNCSTSRHLHNRVGNIGDKD